MTDQEFILQKLGEFAAEEYDGEQLPMRGGTRKFADQLFNGDWGKPFPEIPGDLHVFKNSFGEFCIEKDAKGTPRSLKIMVRCYGLVEYIKEWGDEETMVEGSYSIEKGDFPEHGFGILDREYDWLVNG